MISISHTSEPEAHWYSVPKMAPGMNLRVLLVDDDASVRDALRKVLNGAGYEVITAADGAEAVNRFQARRCDLLILDLGLPSQSGWDAYERITRENPVLPVIIITGRSDQLNVALAAGVGALLEKPLDAFQLLETMHELLIEPNDVRLRRLCGRGGTVRHRSADGSEFLKQRQPESASPSRHWRRSH